MSHEVKFVLTKDQYLLSIGFVPEMEGKRLSSFKYRMGLKYFFGHFENSMKICTIKHTSIFWPKNQNN